VRLAGSSERRRKCEPYVAAIVAHIFDGVTRRSQ
jgi:hypothetical protein